MPVSVVPATRGLPARGHLLSVGDDTTQSRGWVSSQGVVGQVSSTGEQGHEECKGIRSTSRKRLSAEEVQGPVALCAWG